MKFTVVAAVAIFAASVGASKGKGKWFDRFLYIVMENADFGDVVSDPYFWSLAQRDDAIFHMNFTACTHPSFPNYVCGIAGETFGIADDKIHNLTAPTIMNLFAKKGITWKAYMEDYPAQPKDTCYLQATPLYPNGTAVPHSYVRKHNPFVSFLANGKKNKWCNNIVPAEQFEIDLKNGKLPQYSYYVPNLNNDGHDTAEGHDIEFPSDYLKNTWNKRFNDPRLTRNTLIQVTFDERDLYVNDYTKEPLYNQIYSVLFGGALKGKVHKRNRYDFTSYSHYSTLRTLEANWGLGSLGKNDANATVFKL